MPGFSANPSICFKGQRFGVEGFRLRVLGSSLGPHLQGLIWIRAAYNMEKGLLRNLEYGVGVYC